MSRGLLLLFLPLLLVGAAPPGPRQPLPEPVVYHRFSAVIKGGRRTQEELRKLFGLDVVRVDQSNEATYRERPRPWRAFMVWVRSSKPYERVLAHARKGEGVIEVKGIDRGQKTFKRLPVVRSDQITGPSRSKDKKKTPLR
jgi:hypothetical protein